jgi:hypothetical protein
MSCSANNDVLQKQRISNVGVETGLLLFSKIGFINGLRYEFEVRDNNEIDIGYQRKPHRPEGAKTTEMDAVIS